MCAKSLQPCPTLCSSMNVACQAPLSMGLSMQEYWNELSCPPPRDLLDPEIKPTCLMSPTPAGGVFTTSTTCSCCCQVASVVSDSVRPHRRQPTRLPHPWDSPGKNIGMGCHFLLQCMKVKSERQVAQSCPTLCDPMDCSLPGSSVHGIFQARVLEWGAIAFSENCLPDSANY